MQEYTEQLKKLDTEKVILSNFILEWYLASELLQSFFLSHMAVNLYSLNESIYKNTDQINKVNIIWFIFHVWWDKTLFWQCLVELQWSFHWKPANCLSSYKRRQVCHIPFHCTSFPCHTKTHKQSNETPCRLSPFRCCRISYIYLNAVFKIALK